MMSIGWAGKRPRGFPGLSGPDRCRSLPAPIGTGGIRPLDVETRNELRRTYTVVARLAHQGLPQHQLERRLRDIYRNGNETRRAALQQSNEALVALGYSRILYSDLTGD
jgi:hypothetical protein